MFILHMELFWKNFLILSRLDSFVSVLKIMSKDVREFILEVAVKTRTGVVISLPRPARHFHVRDFIIWELGFDRWVFIKSKQGFITNTGRFVDRREAWVLANKANQ